MAAPLANAAQLLQADSALSLSYDQSDTFQWLGYRGVLTGQKTGILTTINASADLLALLTDIQNQANPAYKDMIGAILSMIVNVQVYLATQTGVAPVDQIDPVAFYNALALAQQAGVITGPVPSLTFNFTAGVQTMSCNGVLTDSLRVQLAALIPASSVLAKLLQGARDEAVQLFQSLAGSLVTFTPADLDNYSAPFLGVDPSKQQRAAKAQLVKAFLPLLAGKALPAVGSSDAIRHPWRGSNPDLEALVTDAALLNDPNNPGKSPDPIIPSCGGARCKRLLLQLGK